MARKKPTGKSYTAWVSVTFDLGVPVAGNSMEEALAEARKLGPTDIMNPHDFGYDYNDSSFKLTGINEY